LERQAFLPGLLALDSTAGNGHDALFLAQTLARLTPSFRILAFDIQEAALAVTRARLAEAGLDAHLRCLAAGHETLASHLGADRLAAAMFNLGFLPRSDRSLVTRAATTLAALEAALDALLPQGILSVHAYGGHPGGRAEMEAVEAWFSELPPARAIAARYALCNKPRNPETLFLARRPEEA
jgi:SAM-dependent methyltransferase